MNHIHIAFLVLSSLLACLSHAIVMDHCVGDLSLPRGPGGYSCKDPTKVTVDDFVYTGMRHPGPRNEVHKFNAELVFSNVFPGLNGLGISMARLDIDVGGVVPLHTHRTSEVIILAKGSIIAGFIDTNNTSYYKLLEVGDMMVFPEALQHFQVNVGKINATAFVSLNSDSPGIQLVDETLFAGNFPAELVEKTMLLDPDQVMKLKKAFGTA